MQSIYNSIRNLFTVCILITLLAFSCSQDSNDSLAEVSDNGVGGSYARFIIVNNFMYIVDESSIKTFDLADETKPVQVDEQIVGERIESIFHFANRLFVGSGAGLFIYNIQSNGLPFQLSATNYFESFETFSCDPVAADSTHAYVTLNTLSRVDRPCGGIDNIQTNELRVYDVVDLTNPQLIAQYPLEAPKGVGLDGKTLFVCDDAAGLKIYDVNDPLNIQLIRNFDNFTAFDVIPLDGLLLVVGPENVFQFDYTDLDDIKLVSQIAYGI